MLGPCQHIHVHVERYVGGQMKVKWASSIYFYEVLLPQFY